jgi:hypothetical protein
MCFPCKEIRHNEHGVNKMPWFISELGRMRQTLFLLSDNSKLHKNELNKHLLHEFRNKYNLAIKRAKTVATSKFLKENSNPSSIWRVINQFRNTNNRNEIRYMTSTRLFYISYLHETEFLTKVISYIQLVNYD